MTELHITADSECWTGASTLALMAAKQAKDAVVITAGSSDMVRRIEAEGVKAMQCSIGGMFGSLNLSRVLRHIAGSEFRIYVYSPKARPTVESALKIVGRPEPMTLMAETPQPEFPAVKVDKPAEGAAPLLMWLGNITADCGLLEVIEALGTKTNSDWQLRVVGQGQAKVVSPILKRAKSLGINDRIDWVGYSANPYEQMHGVSAAIVKKPNSVSAREFAAASIPTFTNLSELL